MPEGREIDESGLIKEAQDGDAEAFGQLYEHYAPRVFRYLFANLDDRLDAEDLTEEVFLKVWGALPGYRQRGIPFGGFVFRVARNTLIDHYRRSHRRGPRLSLSEEQVDQGQPDPAERMTTKLERAQVRRLLSGLNDDQRTVLSLRFLAGLTPDETARAMGKSPGAVRVLQHRALNAVRKLLTEEVQGTYEETEKDRGELPDLPEFDPGRS